MSALTSLLVRDGVVPVRKIEQALQRQVISGGDLETVLLEMDAVPENVLAAYRAAVFEVPPASREAVMNVDPDVIVLVPADVATEQRLVPLRVEGRTLHVAVHEPLGGDDIERLGFLLGFEIVSHVACEVRVAAGLAHHYGAELTPRMVRLVSKVHSQPSGSVPEVGRRLGRLSGHLSDIPTKDSIDGPRLEPRYTRSGTMILEPALPESDPPPDPNLEPATSRRHTIPAPSMEVAEPPRASDPPRRERRSKPSIATLLQKHRGPITLGAGERMLRQAADRDQILAVFFAFARQFFDYTVLFVVQDMAADGREAYGVGAPTEEVRGLSVRLDRPGAFAEARRTLTPQVRRLDQTDTDRDVSVGLRRPGSPPAMIMPIAIRQRLVLILYGDQDGEDFDIGAALELVRFGPRVVEAFEQLIIRKKRAGYAAGSDAEPVRREEERDELKTAARDAALRTPAQPTVDRRSWQPGQRKTNPGFAPDVVTSDDSWDAVRVAPQRLRPEALPVTETDIEPPEEPPSEPPPKRPAPKRRRARRPPSAILGIPRRAPPPPPSDNVELDAPGLDDEDDLDLFYGDDDGDYQVELTVDDDDDDAEPEIVIDQTDEDDEDDEDHDGSADDPTDGRDGTDDDRPALEIDEPFDEPVDGRDETPTDPPPRIASTYSIKGAPVDVIRTGRPRSDRPPRPKSDQPPADPLSAEDAERLDRKTPRERPARTSQPIPASHHDPLRSEPPTGLDAGTRSVIVDMGHQVHEQVNDLLSAVSPTEQQHLADGLLALGEAALPALAQAFPGPLRWKREQRGKVPAAGDISPIMRAMVAFGPRAASYVAGLLSSAHPDVRFYAAVVASEIVSPELMDAVAERIHDEDKGVRRIAVQLMPRFAAFRGFAEIQTVVRRTARIRGKDLSRREHAIDAVGELRDTEMVPKLIELLAENDESLIKHSHQALVKITGADHGRAHKRWAAWWHKNRNRHRVEWLIDSLVNAEEPIRRQAGEELKRITQEYYGYHAGSPKRDRELIAKRYRQWWADEGQQRFA